ncbi:MAG: MATE family efflux transporter, partial [Clostridia bacterium]|nr:MATE family efflux transporter [Clostridia bacterium]
MFLRKLYSSESLAKNVDVIGDIPDTRGLYSSFMKIAWPAILESLLISLVGFVDSIMVSSCGTGAVASVGLTMQPRMLFYAVFFSLSVSVTAIVSRRKGQNDRDGANACLSQALTICILLVIVLGVVSFFVAEPLLYLAGAKEETIGNAVIYFRITMIGMLFTAFGLVINSAQRGSGNTKVSLRTNIVANVTNIVFNYLLINGVLFFPQLGVTGAAIATLLGNVASCAMSVYSLVPKDKFLDIRKLRLFRFDKAIIKTIGGISAGAGVEQVFMRFGFFVFSMIIANLGTPEIATHTICMNVQNLSFSAGDGLSVAASALIGQYIGKKRPDLATLYSKAGQRVGMVMSLVLIVALVFFG